MPSLNNNEGTLARGLVEESTVSDSSVRLGGEKRLRHRLSKELERERRTSVRVSPLHPGTAQFGIVAALWHTILRSSLKLCVQMRGSLLSFSPSWGRGDRGLGSEVTAVGCLQGNVLRLRRGQSPDEKQSF